MFKNPDFKGQYSCYFFAIWMLIWGFMDIYTASQGLPVKYCTGYGSSKVCSDVPWWVSYLIVSVGSWLLYVTFRIVFSRCKKRILDNPLEKASIHRQFILMLISPFVIFFSIATGICFFGLLLYS